MPKFNPTYRASKINPKVTAGKFRSSGTTLHDRKNDKIIFRNAEYWQTKFTRNVNRAMPEAPEHEQLLFFINDFIDNAIEENIRNHIEPNDESVSNIEKGILAALIGLGLIMMLGNNPEEVAKELSTFISDAILIKFGGPLGAGLVMMERLPLLAAKKEHKKSAAPKTAKPNSKIKTISKQSLPEATKKSPVKYESSQLKISDDKLYLYNDWFLSFGGLRPLADIGYEDKATPKSISFFPIKRAELEKIVKANNKKSFKELCEKGITYIKRDFERVRDPFKLIINELFTRFNDQNYKPTSQSGTRKYEMGKFFAIKLKEDFNCPGTVESIQKDLDRIFDGARTTLISKGRIKSTGLPVGFIMESDEFLNSVKEEILLPAIDNMVKNNVDSWWDKIKQKNLSADPKSQELMEEFRNREKLSVIVEKYDDHRLKAYRFVTSPHAIVVIHPDPIKADALAYTSVYDPYYMRHYLDKEYNKKNPFSPTHTHEPLHTFDIALCYNKTFGKQIAQPSMNFPCGNEDQIDEAIPDRLAKALKIDNERYSNFLKQISKSGKEIPEDIIAKNHYQNIGDENFKRIGKAYEKVSQVISGEIIPCFTDFVRNPQFLIGFAPNIAVMRSYVISVRDAENQPYVEAQFYSAVMQCDAGKVKEMIKKDPAILDKTYDGIVLNQLPKLLAANHYDKYVNEDFRKDGKNNKSNYAAINGIVKAAYDKYQKENKQRLEVVGQRAFNPHDNREL